MKPLVWAKNLLKPRVGREAKSDAHANFLRKNATRGFFADEGVRWWFFQVLARDALRELKVRSVRKPDASGKVVRRWMTDDLFTVEDYRDRLNQYRESINADIGAARLTLKAAVQRGFHELEEEFPEFC